MFRKLLLALGVMLISYLAVAFVLMEIDPALWEIEHRFAAVFTAVMLSFFAAVADLEDGP